VKQEVYSDSDRAVMLGQMHRLYKIRRATAAHNLVG
jgi:hypothetical protein